MVRVAKLLARPLAKLAQFFEYETETCFMHFTRQFAIASLTLSVLGLWQPDLVKPKDRAPWEENQCPGGFSEKFRLGGEVNNPTTLNLSHLQSLPTTAVTVSFQTKTGLKTETYYGVSLWELINSEQTGLKVGNSGLNPKNAFLRQYILVEATDCYGAVVSIGEIHPNFEAKKVLVAYAKKAEDGKVEYLTEEGFARLVVPGDRAGGRFVSNIRNIMIFSAPPSPLKPKYLFDKEYERQYP